MSATTTIRRADGQRVTCDACGESVVSIHTLPAGWTGGKGGGIRCPECPGKRMAVAS